MGDERAADPRSTKPAAGVDRNNIQSSPANKPSWDSKDVDGSLDELYEYVVDESRRSEAWYWKHKRAKAWGSRGIQWTIVLLGGLAAIIPIAQELEFAPGLAAWLSENVVKAPDSGLLASLLIAVSATLVAFDRSSGLSSGWARYVLTSSAMRSACEEFRMDWTALRSQLSQPPTAEQISGLLQRAKAFRMTIERLIAKETQDWATEFKNNLAQMEKELKDQVESARASREKAEQQLKELADKERAINEQKQAARAAAQAPGAIEATVTNATETDDFKFEAVLENEKGVVVEESISSSPTWARVGVLPGQYRLTIRGAMKKRPSSRMRVITVKPSETSTIELTLPAP